MPDKDPKPTCPLEPKMPDSQKNASSSDVSLPPLSQLGKWGIPAGTVVAVVFVLQFMGVPFGAEAQRRETDLALKFERIEAKLVALESEVVGLRSELRARNDAYITHGQFQVWLYRLQMSNREINLTIPEMP